MRSDNLFFDFFPLSLKAIPGPQNLCPHLTLLCPFTLDAHFHRRLTYTQASTNQRRGPLQLRAHTVISNALNLDGDTLRQLLNRNTAARRLV